MTEPPLKSGTQPELVLRNVPPNLFWWILAGLICIWFLTLDVRHLLSSDEGRYAEIAREMFASGDWVTIRYNDLKYFEKPPFHLWMTALTYEAFGVGEWQARLWGALSGAAGLAMTALAARRWFGAKVGLLTGAVLLAAPTWNIGSHFNSLDIGVAGALASALAAVLVAQHPQNAPQTRRNWMWIAWLAMAVAVLTKGLIGIALPGLVLIVYSLVARDWLLWRRLHIVSGAAIFLLVTAPWFVLVSLRNPEFAHFFFIHEHLQRYLTTVHRRSAPIWFFVPQVLAGFLPWLGLTKRIGQLVRHDVRASGFKPTVLLATWASTIFVFFSLSSSKLPGYILPVFPALAMLAAIVLSRLDGEVWAKHLKVMLVLAGLALLASPLVARTGSSPTSSSLFRVYSFWIGAACLLLLVGLLIARYLNRDRRVMLSMLAASMAFFVGTTVGLLGHESLGKSASGVEVLAPMQALLTPAMPIYSVRLLDHTLPFYLRKTMVMVEVPDELEFGTEQEPEKWLPTLAAFRNRWVSGPPALAVMTHDTFVTLEAERLPMVFVAKDAKRVVVSNFSGAAR